VRYAAGHHRGHSGGRQRYDEKSHPAHMWDNSAIVRKFQTANQRSSVVDPAFTRRDRDRSL
jgi:hypothetical protein